MMYNIWNRESKKKQNIQIKFVIKNVKYNT